MGVWDDITAENAGVAGDAQVYDAQEGADQKCCADGESVFESKFRVSRQVATGTNLATTIAQRQVLGWTRGKLHNS